MPYSYNGWVAHPDLPLRPLVVAGEAFVPGVLDDPDVWTVLNYVAQQMHERVEPIVRDDWHQMDDWGFSYRQTTNDNSLSCHASGTAIDYNATRHPFNVPADRNFTAAQIAEIRQIVAEAGCVTWGGDYRNSPDAMHFEISGTRAEVAAAAERIRNYDKDWFDMATKDDLRDVVHDPEFIAKVAAAVLAERVEVTKPDGSKTRKAASAILRELWQRR